MYWKILQTHCNLLARRAIIQEMKALSRNIRYLSICLAIVISLIISTGCLESDSPSTSFEPLQGAIIGGKRVSINNDEFDATVKLYLYSPSGKNYYCTGTLVDRITVLTAAHCLQKFVRDNDNDKNYHGEVKVMVGNGVPWEENHFFEVSYMAIHPEFKLRNKVGKIRPLALEKKAVMDLGYLELSRPVSEDLVKFIPPVITEDEVEKFV